MFPGKDLTAKLIENVIRLQTTDIETFKSKHAAPLALHKSLHVKNIAIHQTTVIAQYANTQEVDLQYFGKKNFILIVYFIIFYFTTIDIVRSSNNFEDIIETENLRPWTSQDTALTSNNGQNTDKFLDIVLRQYGRSLHLPGPIAKLEILQIKVIRNIEH
ncbi:hypothetical protein QTP88_005759 [Uroleucon formosanum]